jgi:hypothetical protein
MKDFTCSDDDDAVVHAVIGAAGNIYNGNWSPYHPFFDEDPHQNDDHHLQPEWMQFRTMNFGYTKIEADMEELHFSWIGNNDFKVHDHFTLQNRHRKKKDISNEYLM